jgi:hypothetical protein
MTSDYGWDGGFLGPTECRSCAGNGMYWDQPQGAARRIPGRAVLLFELVKTRVPEQTRCSVGQWRGR